MGGRAYGIGDVVVFRLYNFPERKFYGKRKIGRITDIKVEEPSIECPTGKKYLVEESDSPPMWIKHREIQKRIKTPNSRRSP